MKILRPDERTDHGRRRLAREYDVLRALDHPSVVDAVDADVDGPRPHIVLAYIDGRRLSTWVRRRGALDAASVRALGSALASGLGHVHGRGYVHLDVKPSNVLVGASPCLIDFDVARTVEAAGQLRSTVGTGAYAAPEQRDPQEHDVGVAADVWGFGVTLAEAIVGERPPVEAESEARGAVASWTVASAEGAPTPLIEVLVACLDPRPGDRPSAAAIAELLADEQRVSG